MADIIVTLIIVMVVGAACLYIYRSSKKGIKCVGCPYASSCTSGKSCSGHIKNEVKK